MAASPRRAQMFGGPRAGSGAGVALGLVLQDARDAEEDELLTSLEELAQKTVVMSNWADEMYDYVKAFPQSECMLCLPPREHYADRFLPLLSLLRAL